MKRVALVVLVVAWAVLTSGILGADIPANPWE